MKKIFKVLLTIVIATALSSCGLHNVKAESTVAPIEEEAVPVEKETCLPFATHPGWNTICPYEDNDYSYYAYFTETGLQIAFVAPPEKDRVEWGWGFRLKTDINDGWVYGLTDTKENAFAIIAIYMQMLQVSSSEMISNG